MPATTPDRPRVALVTNGLGIGGTEKFLQSSALGAAGGCDVRVVAVKELGPRADQLRAAGIPVACANGDADRLVEQLAGCDVAHVFRHGARERTVPEAARRAGVGKLIESNIFGHVDRSPDRASFACHLFVSRFCLLRYRRLAGLEADPTFFDSHAVLSAPIEGKALREDAPGRREAKLALGLDPDRPVVARVGRADDLKWRRLLVDMVPHLLRLRPDAQVMLVGVTPALRRRLARLGVLERVACLEPTGDPARLASFYAASDVAITAALIGESQGIALGEAMSFGVPVVTSSTPWADNAQIEWVAHGESGWYAGHPHTFAEAVADLLDDDERRAAFGAAAAAAMERLLPTSGFPDRIVSLYRSIASGGGIPADWQPDRGDVEAFGAAYDARASSEFRRLTARERAEVTAVARVREPALRAQRLAERVVGR